MRLIFNILRYLPTLGWLQEEKRGCLCPITSVLHVHPNLDTRGTTALTYGVGHLAVATSPSTIKWRR